MDGSKFTESYSSRPIGAASLPGSSEHPVKIRHINSIVTDKTDVWFFIVRVIILISDDTIYEEVAYERLIYLKFFYF